MGDLGKDVEKFLYSCNLPDKRMASLKRNLPAAFADGCACAEIIHSKFPKLLDIHNYNEASSVTARSSNWNLINKRVLKKLNCQLELRSIDIFVNRKSVEQIVTFLRMLKAKMDAYEPVYASMEFPDSTKPKTAIHEKGTASIKPVMNKRVSQKMDLDTEATNLKNGELSKRLVSREAMEARESAESFNHSTVSRRPSMMQSNKIMDRVRSKDDIKRRASLMSDEDIDSLYRKFASDLSLDIDKEKGSIDEMQLRVESITNKFSDLRNENMEMLKKTEKRLSILRTDSLNPLVNEDNLKDYAENMAVRKGYYENDDDDEYDKNGNDLPPHPDDSSDEDVPDTSSTTLASTNIPFSQQTARSSLSSTGAVETTTHVFDHLTAPTKRASQILKNGKPINSGVSLVTTSSGTKLRRGSVNLTKPKIEKKNVSSSGSSSSSKMEITNRKTSIASIVTADNNKTDTDTSDSPTEAQQMMNSSTNSEDDIPPPPSLPPPSIPLPHSLLEYPLYRRVYSNVHDTYYFIDESTQKSIWEVPEFGIVISTDENSKKEYYTDCATGTVAWTLDSLALKIEEL